MFRFGSFGAWSILAAPRLVLSPYPSPSVSRYCERSEGNASCEFAHPSESESGHPVRPLCDDPAWLGQSSLKLPEALSPNPSESVSLHCEGSDGQASAPIATVQAPTGSRFRHDRNRHNRIGHGWNSQLDPGIHPPGCRRCCPRTHPRRNPWSVWGHWADRHLRQRRHLHPHPDNRNGPMWRNRS